MMPKRFPKSILKCLTHPHWDRLENESLKGTISSPIGRTDPVRARGADGPAGMGVSHRLPKGTKSR